MISVKCSSFVHYKNLVRWYVTRVYILLVLVAYARVIFPVKDINQNLNDQVHVGDSLKVMCLFVKVAAHMFLTGL